MSEPSDDNYHQQAAAIVGQLLANDPRTPGAETALQAFLHADWNVQLIVTGSLAGIIHDHLDGQFAPTPHDNNARYALIASWVDAIANYNPQP